MLEHIREFRFVKKLRKPAWCWRLRQYLPTPGAAYLMTVISPKTHNIVTINWPAHRKKSRGRIVQDCGLCPRETKYGCLMGSHSFDYGRYNIHTNGWIEKAEEYDIISLSREEVLGA